MTIYSLIKPYRQKIFSILGYILIVNLLALVPPWIIKIIIDNILVSQNLKLFNALMLGFLGVLFLRAGFNYIRQYTSRVVGERIVCDLRRRIYDQAQRLSLKRIQELTPSQILNRMTSDLDSLKRFIFGDAIDFIYAALSVVCIVIVLGLINPRLTVVSLLTLPPFGFIYFRSVGQLKEGYKKLRQVHGRLNSRTSEVLHGMNVVRAFNARLWEQELFDQRQGEILKIANRTHSLNTWLWNGIEFFTALGVLAVLWLGGLDVIYRRMTAGELVAFYSYLGMLFSPIIRLVIINSSYQEALAGLGRIQEVLESEKEPRRLSAAIELPKPKGVVVFEQVSFGYTPQQPVLKAISFSVLSGETVGIVGASGAGKTTLMSLILRFYEPWQGRVMLDGCDIRELDLDNLRQHMAVVLQDDFLFNATVGENIRYGSFRATQDEVVRAARIAQAHEFICRLPRGYDTEIGERGCHLSCGQRQRIAIARAVVKNPAILILDEATSAVDALTENKIQKAVKQYLAGKTVFIIAHRFSTIMEADKIIVLDQGRIIETGRHEELLKKQGFYSRLYLEQFKETDENMSIVDSP